MPERRRLPILLALAVPFAACGERQPVNAAKTTGGPQLVRAVPAELQMVQREIPTTAFLESERQAEITTRVAGRIRALHADAGTRLSKDELLAEIDERQARAALEQLLVQKSANAVDKQLAGLEVEAAGRRTQQADLEAQKAKAEFDRQSAMQKEFVAPKALQDAEFAWQAAAEAHKVAQFNERKAALELTRIDSTIAELDARIHEAEVRLEDHRIVAPFDGVVVTRYVASGATVQDRQALFAMVDPDHLVAWLDRPQAEFDLVRKAHSVAFTTDAVPGREFRAEIDLLSPVVDPGTGHFRVRMRVAAADAGTLVPGMFVRARILAEERREALMVPKTAVLSEGNIAVVMVVRDGKACRVDLDPGIELRDFVECRNRGGAGLQPGELVITSGHDDLADQSPVRVAQQ